MRPLTGVFRRPLDAVFAAPSHLALLRVLAESPHGASGREMARLAGVSHQAAQNALARLTELGLVRRVGRGRTFLSVLNPEHTLVTRLIRPLLRGEQQVVRSLVQAVAQAVSPHCQSATLFGSGARGSERPGSDFDLLVVVREGRARPRLMRSLAELATRVSRTWGIRITPLTFTAAQVRRHAGEGHPLFAAAIRDGIPLAGQSLREVSQGT